MPISVFCQLFSPKILRKKIFWHFWTKSSFLSQCVSVRGWSLKTKNPNEDFKLWEKFSVSHLLLLEKKKEIQFPLSFDELEAAEISILFWRIFVLDLFKIFDFSFRNLCLQAQVTPYYEMMIHSVWKLNQKFSFWRPLTKIVDQNQLRSTNSYS